jgi:hypothetical protein
MGGGVGYMTFQSSATFGQSFRIVNGVLVDGFGKSFYYPNNGQIPYPRTYFYQAAATDLELHCARDSNDNIDCGSNNPPFNRIDSCNNILLMYSGTSIDNMACSVTISGQQGKAAVALKAIPAPPTRFRVKVVGGARDGQLLYADATTGQLRFGSAAGVTGNVFTSVNTPSVAGLFKTLAGANVQYPRDRNAAPLYDGGIATANLPGSSGWVYQSMWATGNANPHPFVSGPVSLMNVIALCDDVLYVGRNMQYITEACPQAVVVQLIAIPVPHSTVDIP